MRWASLDRVLMRLDHSEKGSIMRHTRLGDAATHDHSSVAPRFVEAGDASKRAL